MPPIHRAPLGDHLLPLLASKLKTSHASGMPDASEIHHPSPVQTAPPVPKTAASALTGMAPINILLGARLRYGMHKSQGETHGIQTRYALTAISTWGRALLIQATYSIMVSCAFPVPGSCRMLGRQAAPVDLAKAYQQALHQQDQRHRLRAYNPPDGASIAKLLR